MANGFKFALEGFLKGAKAQQERSQANKQFAAQERQRGLLNQVRQAELRQKAINERQSLVEAPEGSPNAISGSVFAEAYGEAGQGLFDLNKNYALPVKPVANRYETVATGAVGSEGGKVDIVRDITTGEEKEVPKFTEPKTGRDDGLNPYQQFQQEKYKTTRQDEKVKRQEKIQARVDENSLKLDALIAGRQGAKKTVETDLGFERTGYQFGDSFVGEKLWKPQASKIVNSLLRDLDIEDKKNALVQGLKSRKELKGKPSSEKREFLKAVLTNNKTLSTEKKKALYQWIEVYTR